MQTDDQLFCESLLRWFNTLFKFATVVTEEFIASYSIVYPQRVARIMQDQKDLETIIPGNGDIANVRVMDLTNQFFQLEHYTAFEGTKPWSMDEAVDEERNNVRLRLFDPHELLYPHIQRKRWNLHEHYVFEDTVSSAVHSAFTSPRLDGIWLHYGRDKETIKELDPKMTPIDFMRMQVIIHKDSVGVWNRVGKDYGSRIDREYFKRQMKDNPAYRQQFYSIISKLPDEYYIRISGELKYVKEFPGEPSLSEFVSTDQQSQYFIIGMEFPPNDPRISSDNIVISVLEQFAFLYPTYELIRYNLV